MVDIDTSEQNTTPPTHEDFHWISGQGQDERFADFIEAARDVSAGIHSCMQIIYAGELVREENQDAEIGQKNPPSIGKTDAANLFRLSMAAAKFLRHSADEQIEILNQFSDE